MAKYIATTDGNWSTVGTWSTGTNTPSNHASTRITIDSAKYTDTFTAPSTSDDCLGVIINISALATSGYSYVITLQENSIDTAATKTVAVADLALGAYFVKFTTPYTFTSTTAGYYRFKIDRSGSGSGSTTVVSNSAGTLVAFQAVDDRAPAAAPTTGDDVWIIGANESGTISVTVDGDALVGSATDTTVSPYYMNQACYIGRGGLLTWNTSASATLTCKGMLEVVGHSANKAELRIGTTSSAYPAAYTAKLRFDQNGTANRAALGSNLYSRIQLHGYSHTGTTNWKTTYASGAGSVADPMVVNDSVDWTTGQEVLVCSTGAGIHSTWQRHQNELCDITKVDATTYSLVSKREIYNADFEGAIGGSGGWTNSVGSGAIAADTTTYHGGKQSAKLTAGSTTNTNIYQSIFTNPGKSVTLKFWTRGDGTYEGRYQIYSVSGSTNIVATKGTGVTGTTWTEVSETFVVPASCYEVRIYLHCPSTNTGIAYFDDVSATVDGLMYSKSAGAKVLHMTRNVVMESVSSTEGFTALVNSSISGDIDYDWIRINHPVGRAVGFYSPNGGNYQACDYSVIYNNLKSDQSAFYYQYHAEYNMYPETFTGNIVYNSQYYAFDVSQINKTLVDCFAVNAGYGGFYAVNGSTTMTRCIGVSCNRNNIGTGATFQLGGSGTILTDCESQSAGLRSIYISSSCTAKIYRLLSGTLGINNTTYSGDITGTRLFNNVLFDNCEFQYAIPTYNNLANNTLDSEWRVVNYNQDSTVDFVITPLGYRYRTGTGLADTTSHTGGYAVRFQPISSTTPLAWTFDIATGNIQTYQATISVWVKINNAAYYAGTHQNPKLTVNYDNGTLATATATDTTDWQQLSVSFTPTTTYGVVTVTIDGYTDATTTNAYFYVDDFENDYPSGYAVNLGKFDVWADAKPVTPSNDTTGVLSYDWTQDPYVVHTEAQANALTGIALNYTLKTITVTEDHTLTEIYEYCKASARTNGVLQALSTKDGITYALSGGWTLVLDENVDITETPFLDLGTTTLEFPASCSMEPTLINGELALPDAGTIECNMNGISIDYQATGTFDHSGSTTDGTITLDTSTSSTVTAKFVPGTTVDNQDEVHITVESSTSVNIVVSGLVVGSQVRVTETVSGDELINETATGTSVSTSYVYTTDTAISILVRKSSAATKYLEWTGAGTITTAGANITVVQVADANIEATSPTATDWSVDFDTKVISATGTPDSLTTGELYTWLMDQMDAEANMEHLNPMTCEVKDASYTLRNGYTLDTGVEQYLSTGGIVTSDGNTIYTNIFTVGSLVASSQVYIKQDGAKLSSWWSTGNIDVLIKVKSGGSLIDSGNLYFYVRKFGNTYEYTSLDASAGGRQVVAVANATDNDNQTASGTVATWSDITITWGSTTKDIGDGEGAKPYDVVVDGAGRTVAQIYEYLKYVCRDGETTEQNGVDGELYLSASPSTYTLVKTGPFGSIAGGTLFLARGVYLEDMASADSLNYQVIDSDGGTHTPPTPPVYISLTGIVSGSRVQLYNTDTSTELYNDIVSATTLDVEYTPAESAETIRVRVSLVDGVTAYSFYETNISASTNGGSAIIAQVEDTVYNSNGIDGSAITSCSVSGTTIKVFVDDADNAINIQDIYNWYCYMLFTETGIRDQGNNLRAVDTTNYVAYNTLLINNQAEDPLLLGGGYILQNTGGTALDVYDTSGNPIFMGYNHAVGVGSGLSTEEHNKLDSLKNPTMLIDGELIV